jgi:SAM-dependent methyltransferase
MSAGVTWSASFGGAAVSSLRIYDELMVPRLFAPWGELLVDRLEIATGEAVLDVACGPGSVTRIAAERVGAGGRVKGCDLSPAMLALADAKPPTPGGASIEYVEGPADRLPAQDDEFDVVTCQQGLQFFPDRRGAVAEMRRALRPGGRLGVAVWTDIEHSPPFCALANAIGEVAGAELADRYRAGPWGFPNGEHLGSLLKEAGFVDVRVSSHVLRVTFEDGPVQLAATLAVTPLAAELDQLSDERKRRLIEALARHIGDGPIESQLQSNIALARR